MSLKYKFEVTMDAKRLRFQKNKLSFWLCLLAIAFDILSLSSLFGYPPKLNPDLLNGLDIVYHIVFLMLVFMVAEKTKRYDHLWSYGAMILGAMQIVKIPLFLNHYYAQEIMTSGAFVLNIMYMVICSACLIFAGIICYIRAKKLAQFRAEQGEANNG